MKIRKQLGSEAVRDLVDDARARARAMPARSVRNAWPPSRRVISEAFDRDTEVVSSDND